MYVSIKRGILCYFLMLYSLIHNLKGELHSFRNTRKVGHLRRSFYSPFGLRFLYNRLALGIHYDSHLTSMTLPWQLLSVIKVVLFHQILQLMM